jgi:hypothetical protein
MDEHEFMEQEEDDEFVEEPMAADFDFTNANDQIIIDDPISQGFYYFLLINSN